MDELCQRIMIKAGVHNQIGQDSYQPQVAILSSSPTEFHSPRQNSLDDPSNTSRAATMPLPPISTQSRKEEGQRSILHRLLSSRPSSDTKVPKTAKNLHTANLRASPPRSVPTDHTRVDSPQMDRQQSKAHRVLGYLNTSDLDIGRTLSRHSSMKDADSYHRATSSISSSAPSDIGGRDSLSDTSFLDPIDNISQLDELEHEISEMGSTDVTHIGDAKATMDRMSDPVSTSYIELPATSDTEHVEDEMEALRALGRRVILLGDLNISPAPLDSCEAGNLRSLTLFCLSVLAESWALE